MMRIIILVLLLFCQPALSQEVEVVQFERIEKILKEDNPKLRIYNFWATWCRSCIIEMPYFEEIAKSKRDKVEMNFISLDYADQVESTVKPFLKRKAITSRVYLIDNLDYNSWIDKVDPRWSGALPATVFITPSGKKIFYEKEFKKEELENIVESLLNQ
jgi:thiol-disulfide isomerase/thioredoxin